MLTILCSILLISIGWKYRNTISKKYTNYMKIVKSYQDQNPSKMKINAYWKALLLVIKCTLIVYYQTKTSVAIPGYTIIKYVIGGQYYSHIIPIKRGPKPELEYGYIDGIVMTELITKLSGIQRDFNGHPEILCTFGNHIRYKFYGEEEKVIVKTGNEMEKKENLHKILNFYQQF